MNRTGPLGPNPSGHCPKPVGTPAGIGLPAGPKPCLGQPLFRRPWRTAGRATPDWDDGGGGHWIGRGGHGGGRTAISGSSECAIAVWNGFGATGPPVEGQIWAHRRALRRQKRGGIVPAVHSSKGPKQTKNAGERDVGTLGHTDWGRDSRWPRAGQNRRGPGRLTHPLPSPFLPSARRRRHIACILALGAKLEGLGAAGQREEDKAFFARGQRENCRGTGSELRAAGQKFMQWHWEDAKMDKSGLLGDSHGQGESLTD